PGLRRGVAAVGAGNLARRDTRRSRPSGLGRVARRAVSPPRVRVCELDPQSMTESVSLWRESVRIVGNRNTNVRRHLRAGPFPKGFNSNPLYIQSSTLSGPFYCISRSQSSVVSHSSRPGPCRALDPFKLPHL